MVLPDFLRSTDGEIQLTGHRLGLYHLVVRYNEGESAEMLASRYPTLPLSLVHKVIAFYLDNQSEVDSYMATCATTLDDERRSAKELDLSALRRRLSSTGPPTSASEATVG